MMTGYGRWMAATWVSAALVIGGCEAAAPRIEGAAGAATATPGRGLVDVPPPPGVSAAVLGVRSGAALGKASLSLEQILATLARPEYLPGPDAAPLPPPTSEEEPPLAVQRFYARARQAWLAGNRYEAINQLQAAHRLMPGDAQIVRTLGRVYFDENRVQAAQFLRQAIEMDPTDAESLMMMGAYAVGQGRHDDAVVLIAAALDEREHRPDLDPVIWPLMHFDLASALEFGGYDRAAVEQWLSFLHAQPQGARSLRLFQRAFMLAAQQAMTWQRLGDAYHRLNQPRQALRAYEHAMAGESTDMYPFVARLAYTHLRIGQPEQASKLVVARLGDLRADPRWLSLIRYLGENGVARPRLAAVLREAYEQSDRSADMAITIADMLEPHEARQLLAEHLAARPSDTQVFERFVANALAHQPGEAPDPRRAAEAITLLVRTMDQLPAVADALVDIWFAQVDEPAWLTQWLEAMEPATPADQPLRDYLRGRALLRAGQTPVALALFEAVVAERPTFEAARVAWAQVLVERQAFDEARRVLAGAGDDPGPRIIMLRAEVLAQTGDVPQALQLLDDLARSHPADIDLAVRRAELLAATGNPEAAQMALLEKVNMYPGAEPAYEALFELYEARLVPNAEQRYVELLERAARSIPNAWITRLKRAQLQSARPELAAEAEQAFAQLLRERPEDLRPFDGLLEVMWRSGRVEEANALLEARLQKEADHPGLLATAVGHYERRTSDRARTIALSIQYLESQPAQPQRDQRLAYFYVLADRDEEAIRLARPRLDDGDADNAAALLTILNQAYARVGRVAEAEAAIEQVIRRFPDRKHDLMLMQAMMLEQTDRPEQAEAILQALLAEDPAHANANNMLAYHWALRGVNLAEAHALIEAALKQRPISVAYRDTLGWVLYKMGRFEDAARELRRAVGGGSTNPVILDHLGDTLYRLGDRDEAARMWTLAQTHYDPYEARFDSDQRDLAERLTAKLEAIAAGAEPPVAEVPPAPPAPAAP